MRMCRDCKLGVVSDLPCDPQLLCRGLALYIWCECCSCAYNHAINVSIELPGCLICQQTKSILSLILYPYVAIFAIDSNGYCSRVEGRG